MEDPISQHRRRPPIFSATKMPPGRAPKAPSRRCWKEAELGKLGIKLPPPPKGNTKQFKPIQKSGDLLILSGHLPVDDDGSLITGKIGNGANTVEEGYEASRRVALNIIDSLKEELDDLDRVIEVVMVFGIVQSTADFHDQDEVIEGCSDTFLEVFGTERAIHRRAAIVSNKKRDG
jgi:enamine deaminase RidA (YjgF/YER057c/UK114 family)